MKSKMVAEKTVAEKREQIERIVQTVIDLLKEKVEAYKQAEEIERRIFEIECKIDINRTMIRIFEADIVPPAKKDG